MIRKLCLDHDGEATNSKTKKQGGARQEPRHPPGQVPGDTATAKNTKQQHDP